jgi:hypothetical protein
LGWRSRLLRARFRARRAVNSLLQGVLTVELVGLGTVVANTHLTANKDGDWSAGNRYHAFQRRQVEMVHAALRRARRADTELMVVTGDFNIASGASLYPLIVDGGAWRDPFATIDPVTFHPEFLPAGCTGNRIDYALVLGDEARFPVIDSRLLFAEPVVLTDGSRMYLSDHVALTVRLGLGCVPTLVDVATARLSSLPVAVYPLIGQSRERSLRAGGHVGGEDVVRVAVEVLAGLVVAHGGAGGRRGGRRSARPAGSPRHRAWWSRTCGAACVSDNCYRTAICQR